MGTIYRNPALVELIIELQWELSPTLMPPGSGVDPFFDVVRADITPRLAQVGYANSQDLAPSGIPREILAWKPIVRFAPAPDQWPKVQLGPGIFSVHIAGQQYTGWPDFEPSVGAALDALLASFPSYQKLLKLKQIQVRYINAFTAAHGFENYAQFTSRYLGLTSVMPRSFLDALGVSPENVSTTSQTKFPITVPPAAHVSVQAAEGKVNNMPGCLIQITIEGGDSVKVEHVDLMAWLNGAHEIARKTFLSLAAPELLRSMQPEERP